MNSVQRSKSLRNLNIRPTSSGSASDTNNTQSKMLAMMPLTQVRRRRKINIGIGSHSNNNSQPNIGGHQQTNHQRRQSKMTSKSSPNMSSTPKTQPLQMSSIVARRMRNNATKTLPNGGVEKRSAHQSSTSNRFKASGIVVACSTTAVNRLRGQAIGHKQTSSQPLDSMPLARTTATKSTKSTLLARPEKRNSPERMVRQQRQRPASAGPFSSEANRESARSSMLLPLPFIAKSTLASTASPDCDETNRTATKGRKRVRKARQKLAIVNAMGGAGNTRISHE